MKKTVKRILCGAMALTMVSSIVLERVLHIHSDGVASANSGLATEASFTNVTGQFDTSKMVQENFNDTVKKTEDTTIQHKTRTVMVTLSAKPLIERANGEPVGEYMQSWDGNRAVAEIGAEQTAFLKSLSQAGIRYELVRTYNTVLNGVGAKELRTECVYPVARSSAETRTERFFFTGDERRAKGDVLTWRMELYVDGKLVDSKQSYLWE